MFHCQFTMQVQRGATGRNGWKKKKDTPLERNFFHKERAAGERKEDRVAKKKKYTHFCSSGYLCLLLLLLYALGMWCAFADSFYFSVHRRNVSMVKACLITSLSLLPPVLLLSLPSLPHVGSPSASQGMVGEGTTDDEEETQNVSFEICVWCPGKHWYRLVTTSLKRLLLTWLNSNFQTSKQLLCGEFSNLMLLSRTL